MLDRLARVDGVLPAADVFLYVVGVNKLRPAPIFDLLEGKARELRPLLIEIVNVAVGLGREHFLRHGLGQKTETFGALAQPGFAQFRLSALDHVPEHQDRANYAAALVPDQSGTAV